MEIKYLLEITEPQNDDWLVIQRGDLTGKIKYSNLNIRLPDPDPTPIGDEDDMYMGINPPNNPVPGKLWGELDDNGRLINTWANQPDGSVGAGWVSLDTKQTHFTLTKNNNQFQLALDRRYNYLIQSISISLYSTQVDSNAVIVIGAGSERNVNELPLHTLNSSITANITSIDYAYINKKVDTYNSYTGDDGYMSGIHIINVASSVANYDIDYSINGLFTYRLLVK